MNMYIIYSALLLCVYWNFALPMRIKILTVKGKSLLSVPIIRLIVLVFIILNTCFGLSIVLDVIQKNVMGWVIISFVIFISTGAYPFFSKKIN